MAKQLNLVTAAPDPTPESAAGDLASDHSLELVPAEPDPTPSIPRLLTDQETEAFWRESFRMGLQLSDTIPVLRSFNVELPHQLAAWQLPAGDTRPGDAVRRDCRGTPGRRHCRS